MYGKDISADNKMANSQAAAGGSPKYVIVESYGDSLLETINSVFEKTVMTVGMFLGNASVIHVIL